MLSIAERKLVSKKLQHKANDLNDNNQQQQQQITTRSIRKIFSQSSKKPTAKNCYNNNQFVASRKHQEHNKRCSFNQAARDMISHIDDDFVDSARCKDINNNSVVNYKLERLRNIDDDDQELDHSQKEALTQSENEEHYQQVTKQKKKKMKLDPIRTTDDNLTSSNGKHQKTANHHQKLTKLKLINEPNHHHQIRQTNNKTPKTTIIKMQLMQLEQENNRGDDRRLQQLPVNSSENVCAGCSLPIREQFLLEALDKRWHEDCLKCACCECRLGEVGSSLFVHLDKIFCRRDFLRIFGQRGECAVCRKTIEPYELVMRAKGHAYHIECFACQRCQARFCVGDQFCLWEPSKIVCFHCHQSATAASSAATPCDDPTLSSSTSSSLDSSQEVGSMIDQNPHQQLSLRQQQPEHQDIIETHQAPTSNQFGEQLEQPSENELHLIISSQN